MNESAVHPIIYVRGYAMTPSEIEDAVADPYMGFNIGSCKVRQLWDGAAKKYFVESPLVRLLKRFRYDDVFEEGYDRVSDLTAPSTADGTIPPVPYRSIVIYRYYEPSSEDIGTGVRPDMKRFAQGLGELILKLRERIYPNGKDTVITPEEREAGKRPYDRFRVYLVAHSMGGLVCRAFLQNDQFGSAEARGLVDKVFTYATPHNGIDIGVLGNIPKWLSLYGMNTFNREELAELLALKSAAQDKDGVDLLTNIDASRVFNLVGTNPGDYKVAAGLSSAAVGDASDGLVRIKNATTRQRTDTGFLQSPNAFVHRSHSGFFGIVNSEEGYQNLVRFLYGDVRADGVLEIDELTLPPAVRQAMAAPSPDRQREQRDLQAVRRAVRESGEAQAGPAEMGPEPRSQPAPLQCVSRHGAKSDRLERLVWVGPLRACAGVPGRWVAVPEGPLRRWLSVPGQRDSRGHASDEGQQLGVRVLDGKSAQARTSTSEDRPR